MRAVIALAILLTFSAQASTKVGIGEEEKHFFERLYFKNARDVVNFLKLRRWTDEAKSDPYFGVGSVNMAAHDPTACMVRDIRYRDSALQFYVVTPEGTFAVLRVKVVEEYRSDVDKFYTEEDTADFLYFAVRE